MNTLFPGIEDVELSPPMMTLKFDKTCELPKLGETLTDGKNYELVVIKVDKEAHSAQVVINSSVPLKDMIVSKRKEMSISIEDIATLIHKDTSEGMSKFLSWEQLETSQQNKYMATAKAVIKILEKRSLIKYGPHDI